MIDGDCVLFQLVLYVDFRVTCNYTQVVLTHRVKKYTQLQERVLGAVEN